MARGEKSFTTNGTPVDRFKSTPLPPGDYDLKLLGSEAKAGRKDEPGAVPYVTVPFQVLGTGENGGKDRKLYHYFFLSIKPDKSGGLRPNKQDQINGLAKGLGDEFTTSQILSGTDKDGETVDYIDPADVVAWLKERDGAIVRAHTKVQPANGQHAAKGVIHEFIEVEGGGSQPFDDAEEEEVAPPPPAKTTVNGRATRR